MKDIRSDPTSDARFHENLLASFPDGIMVLGEDLHIAYMNPAMEQACKASLLSLKGKPFADFAYRNPHLLALVKKTWETGAGRHEMDYPFQTADGATPVLVTTALIAGPTGLPTGLALAFHDIRYFKEMEDNTRQADRLQLLGRLAATMAHEIKNPLGGIRGCAQLLSSDINDERLRKYIQAIIKEVDRINRIVETALDLRRSPEIITAPVNIHKILNEILLLEGRNEKFSRIRFRVEFDPSIPDIPADAGQLAQVFLNLIQNGIEAMNCEGEMVLSTRVSSEYQIQRGQKGHLARMLLVEIRDQGKGIPKEVRDGLFTPFFTTKKKGSGLGLVVSQQIVEKHNGWLKLEDNHGGGTRVKVFLPLK